MKQYLALVRKASAAADKPYKEYNGELVADPTADQGRAYAAIRDMQGAYNGYYDNAATAFDRAGRPITPIAFSGAEVDKYMNPYVSRVVDATAANIQRENAIEQQRVLGNAIARGSFGGDRAGFAQAELARSQGLARNQTLAELMSQGYGQALSMFSQQQGVDLNAQQQNNANALAQAQGWMGLGQGRTQTDLAQINAQLQAGQLQQQQRQNELNAKYQQWQNQRAYPFQSIGWLGNIVTGVGNQAGGTQTTTQPNGSLVGGLVGLGTAGLGALSGSDRRMKTGVARIGRTDDGQPIYKFRYKGDDSGRTHIGLMADQVEKHHPEAVHRGVGGMKFVDYDAATKGVARRAWGGSVSGSTGSASPYESAVIGADPFGENAIVVRVPGLAVGGGLAPIGMDPYEAGVGYIPKPRPIGLGKFTVDTPRAEAPKGLFGTGVETKDLMEFGKAAKGAMPKVKGLLGIKTPEDVQKQEDGLLPNASYARGGKAVPPRGVSRAAFSQRSAGDNPGNEWGGNDGYPTPGLSPDGNPGYNNPLAGQPRGGVEDDSGYMGAGGMRPDGSIGPYPSGQYATGNGPTSGPSLPNGAGGPRGPGALYATGADNFLPTPRPSPFGYTGMGGPLVGPPVAGRVPAVAHARVTAPDYRGTTSLNGGVMGGYNGPMSDAGFGSVADPNNYGGFAGHGYGTHDYGVGAQMTGFTGADNFGFTDFSGNSPSSNGPSSGGSSGGYSGGSAGYGTAGDNEPRARGGRTIAPMPALPPAAPAAPMGFDTGVARMRVRRSAPALHQTRSIGDIGGAGGGWDPAGNPVDPGINSGTTVDGRTGSPGNGYADPTFGGTLQDQGGWADVGGWQNAGDYLRGQLPGDPNGFQGMNFDFPGDFSKQPVAERGWGAFGPNGMQYGAMGPAPNPHPLGYSYSPNPTSGGSGGGYGGGFSGSADAPGTAAGTGSFGTADGYDSRARGGGLAALMFARGGAKRVAPRGGVEAATAASTRDRIGDAFGAMGGNDTFYDAGGYGGTGGGTNGMPTGSLFNPSLDTDFGTMSRGFTYADPVGVGTSDLPRTNIYGQISGIQYGFNQPPVPGQVPVRNVTTTTTTVRPAPGAPTVIKAAPAPVGVQAPVAPGAPAPGGQMGGYSGPMSDAGYGSVADPNNYGGFAGHGFGAHDYGVGAQMTGFTGGDNFGFTDFNGSEPGSNGPSSGGSSGGYSGATSGGFGGSDGFESRARGGGVARLKFASGGVPMSEYITEEEARAQLAKDEEAAARFVAQGKAEGTVGADGKMPRPAAVLNPEAERRVIPGSRRAIPMVEEPDMAPPPKGVAAIARMAPESGVAVKPVPKSGPSALVEKIRNSVTGEGEGFSPETRAALMAAGFRMMASTNRNPLIAIGEGGGAGVSQYNTGVQQTQGQTRLDLLARQLQQEKELRQQEIDISNKATDAQIDASRRAPGLGGFTVFEKNNANPRSVIGADTPPLGTSGPVAGVPGLKKDDRAPGEPVLPPVPGDPAGDQGDILKPYRRTEKPKLDEAIEVIPAGPASRNIFVPELRDINERRSAPVRERTQAEAATATAAALRLKSVEHALDAAPKSGALAPGATAELRQSLGASILDAATVLGLKGDWSAGLSRDVGNAEEWRKSMRVMAAELARAGGQESYGALAASLETVPSQMLTTVGAKRVLEGLKAVNQRALDKQDFLEKWQRLNPGHALDTAEQAFNLRYPPSLYATRAIVKSIPPAAVEAFRKDKSPLAAQQFDEAFGKGSAAAVQSFEGS